MSALSLLALLTISYLQPADAPDSVTESPQVERLQEFLDAGFDRRRTSERELQQQYRDLQESLDDELTSEYAYVLALLKRNQFDEAIEVLNQLCERSNPAYAPAWRAAIWNRLSRRQYEPGFERLLEFSRRTADPDQQWSQLGQPEANARWIGQLVEGLGYQFTSGQGEELLNETREIIEASLPAPLKQEYQAGVGEVQAFRQQLEGGAAATQQQAAKTQAQEAEEKAEELKAKEEETLDTKDQLKLTAAEWKKKLDKELVDFGRKIGSLQRDYNFLDARRASLERSITLVQREKTALDLAKSQRDQLRGGNRTNPSSNQYIAESNRLLQKYTEYRAQHQQTLQQMQQVAAQGTQLLAQRQALINEYQQATGELVKRDKALEKLAKQLSKQQEEIAAGENRRDPAELKILRKRMRYFSTYVEFDLDEEKQKLIDSVRAAQGD